MNIIEWFKNLFRPHNTVSVEPNPVPPKDPAPAIPAPKDEPIIPVKQTPVQEGGVYLSKKGDFVINQHGLDLVKHFEGMYLHAYHDSVGVLTIGYGRIKYDNGQSVKAGDTCTVEQAVAWLLEDLEKDGAQYVRSSFKSLALNRDQFSALTSFTFNRGAGRLHTLCDEHLRQGLDAVGKGLLEFDYAGSPKRTLEGLSRRRAAEHLLFLSKDWTVCKDTNHWRDNYHKELAK